MVQLAGKYELSESINFAEHLIKRGIPEDKARESDKSGTIEVQVNGDKITLTTGGLGHKMVHDLEVGKAVEHKNPEGKVATNVTSLDGDVLTVETKFPDGKSFKRVYAFSDSGIVETIPSSPEVKRVFKRV